MSISLFIVGLVMLLKRNLFRKVVEVWFCRGVLIICRSRVTVDMANTEDLRFLILCRTRSRRQDRVKFVKTSDIVMTTSLDDRMTCLF